VYDGLVWEIFMATHTISTVCNGMFTGKLPASKNLSQRGLQYSGGTVFSIELHRSEHVLNQWNLLQPFNTVVLSRQLW
jgi:hypothetical protein